MKRAAVRPPVTAKGVREKENSGGCPFPVLGSVPFLSLRTRGSNVPRFQCPGASTQGSNVSGFQCPEGGETLLCCLKVELPSKRKYSRSHNVNTAISTMRPRQYVQYDQDQENTTKRGRLQGEKHDEDVQQGVAIPKGEVFADFYRKRGRSPPRRNRESELP